MADESERYTWLLVGLRCEKSSTILIIHYQRSCSDFLGDVCFRSSNLKVLMQTQILSLQRGNFKRATSIMRMTKKSLGELQVLEKKSDSTSVLPLRFLSSLFGKTKQDKETTILMGSLLTNDL